MCEQRFKPVTVYLVAVYLDESPSMVHYNVLDVRVRGAAIILEERDEIITYPLKRVTKVVARKE